MGAKDPKVADEPIKIVVIDDDEAVCLSIKRMLDSSTDYETLLAYGGKQGVKLVRREIPDLVLLDIVMPDLSGIEVLRKLKEDKWTLHIPIIMFTGYDNEKNREESTYWYADAFLPKNVGKEKLLATVKELLALRDSRYQRAK